MMGWHFAQKSTALLGMISFFTPPPVQMISWFKWVGLSPKLPVRHRRVWLCGERNCRVQSNVYLHTAAHQYSTDLSQGYWQVIPSLFYSGLLTYALDNCSSVSCFDYTQRPVSDPSLWPLLPSFRNLFRHLVVLRQTQGWSLGRGS